MGAALDTLCGIVLFVGLSAKKVVHELASLEQGSRTPAIRGQGPLAVQELHVEKTPREEEPHRCKKQHVLLFFERSQFWISIFEFSQ